jgi:hypothetical protein
MRNRPLAMTRELAISLGLLRPVGSPTAKTWHEAPTTLRMDARGRRAALVHQSEGPIPHRTPPSP